MGSTTDTRQRMVASASALLACEGVAGATVAKVLAHSGGPRGSVQFHFPGGKAEMVQAALESAAVEVGQLLSQAAESQAAPGDVIGSLCDLYADRLEASDFTAGCPIWSVANESYADPALGPVVSEIVRIWLRDLARLLVEAGHSRVEARDLAAFVLSSIEGAVSLARVQRSTRPIDVAAARLVALL